LLNKFPFSSFCGLGGGFKGEVSLGFSQYFFIFEWKIKIIKSEMFIKK